MLYRHPPDSTPLSLHDALPILLAEQVPTRSFHLLEIRSPGLVPRMEPRVVVQAVDDLARALEPHRVAGHAGQVGGVLEALADDQHVRADLVNEVADRGIHGGDVGTRPAA